MTERPTKRPTDQPTSQRTDQTIHSQPLSLLLDTTTILHNYQQKQAAHPRPHHLLIYRRQQCTTGLKLLTHTPIITQFSFLYFFQFWEIEIIYNNFNTSWKNTEVVFEIFFLLSCKCKNWCNAEHHPFIKKNNWKIMGWKCYKWNWEALIPNTLKYLK